jgi:transposase
MLKKPAPEQTALEMVTLDSLVPKDHLLRKIDAVIDFSFIHDRVAGLYCADNGRPPLDPTLMFKALFIGYLFGIRSERQLVREIEVNVAYRWFLRMKLGLVDGKVLYTDSTHLKANANKGSYDLAMLQKSRSDYWDDLDRAIEAERSAHGQKPLKEKEREPQVKETKVSRTDPEAGYMVRDGKPKGFFYLDHRTVDGRHAIITAPM